jgi:hypothetical protein
MQTTETYVPFRLLRPCRDALSNDSSTQAALGGELHGVAVAGQTYAGQLRSATSALIRSLAMDRCPNSSHRLSKSNSLTAFGCSSAEGNKKPVHVFQGQGAQDRQRLFPVAPASLVPSSIAGGALPLPIDSRLLLA